MNHALMDKLANREREREQYPEVTTLDDRLRAIAANAVLSAAMAHGRFTLTDDDARRIELVLKLLPRTTMGEALPEQAPAPVHAAEQPKSNPVLAQVEGILEKLVEGQGVAADSTPSHSS